MDKLRQQCLKRGVNGIQAFGRLYKSFCTILPNFTGLYYYICILFFCRSFRIFDVNGDRKLNYEEIKKGVTDYGLQLDESDYQEIFDEMDFDESGLVSYDEFLRALRVR